MKEIVNVSSLSAACNRIAVNDVVASLDDAKECYEKCSGVFARRYHWAIFAWPCWDGERGNSFVQWGRSCLKATIVSELVGALTRVFPLWSIDWIPYLAGLAYALPAICVLACKICRSSQYVVPEHEADDEPCTFGFPLSFVTAPSRRQRAKLELMKKGALMCVDVLMDLAAVVTFLIQGQPFYALGTLLAMINVRDPFQLRGAWALAESWAAGTETASLRRHMQKEGLQEARIAGVAQLYSLLVTTPGALPTDKSIFLMMSVCLSFGVAIPQGFTGMCASVALRTSHGHHLGEVFGITGRSADLSKYADAAMSLVVGALLAFENELDVLFEVVLAVWLLDVQLWWWSTRVVLVMWLSARLTSCIILYDAVGVGRRTAMAWQAAAQCATPSFVAFLLAACCAVMSGSAFWILLQAAVARCFGLGWRGHVSERPSRWMLLGASAASLAGLFACWQLLSRYPYELQRVCLTGLFQVLVWYAVAPLAFAFVLLPWRARSFHSQFWLRVFDANFPLGLVTMMLEMLLMWGFCGLAFWVFIVLFNPVLDRIDSGTFPYDWEEVTAGRLLPIRVGLWILAVFLLLMYYAWLLLECLADRGIARRLSGDPRAALDTTNASLLATGSVIVQLDRPESCLSSMSVCSFARRFRRRFGGRVGVRTIRGGEVELQGLLLPPEGSN